MDVHCFVVCDQDMSIRVCSEFYCSPSNVKTNMLNTVYRRTTLHVLLCLHIIMTICGRDYVVHCVPTLDHDILFINMYVTPARVVGHRCNMKFKIHRFWHFVSEERLKLRESWLLYSILIKGVLRAVQQFACFIYVSSTWKRSNAD